MSDEPRAEDGRGGAGAPLGAVGGDAAGGEGSTAQNRKGCGGGCLGVVALVIVTAVACSIGGGEDSWEPTATEARLVCEDWVRDQLKAPATADFTDGAESGGPSSYTISGEVDAENSFGATLRTSWTCSIEYRDSDEQWHGRAVLDELG